MASDFDCCLDLLFDEDYDILIAYVESIKRRSNIISNGAAEKGKLITHLKTLSEHIELRVDEYSCGTVEVKAVDTLIDLLNGPDVAGEVNTGSQSQEGDQNHPFGLNQVEDKLTKIFKSFNEGSSTSSRSRTTAENITQDIKGRGAVDFVKTRVRNTLNTLNAQMEMVADVDVDVDVVKRHVLCNGVPMIYVDLTLCFRNTSGTDRLNEILIEVLKPLEHENFIIHSMSLDTERQSEGRLFASFVITFTDLIEDRMAFARGYLVWAVENFCKSEEMELRSLWSTAKSSNEFTSQKSDSEQSETFLEDVLPVRDFAEFTDMMPDLFVCVSYIICNQKWKFTPTVYLEKNPEKDKELEWTFNIMHHIMWSSTLLYPFMDIRTSSKSLLYSMDDGFKVLFTALHTQITLLHEKLHYKGFYKDADLEAEKEVLTSYINGAHSEFNQKLKNNRMYKYKFSPDWALMRAWSFVCLKHFGPAVKIIVFVKSERYTDLVSDLSKGQQICLGFVSTEVFLFMGFHDRAMQCALNSQKLCEAESGERSQIRTASALFLVGYVNLCQEKKENAKICFNKASSLHPGICCDKEYDCCLRDIRACTRLTTQEGISFDNSVCEIRDERLQLSGQRLMNEKLFRDPLRIKIDLDVNIILGSQHMRCTKYKEAVTYFEQALSCLKCMCPEGIMQYNTANDLIKACSYFYSKKDMADICTKLSKAQMSYWCQDDVEFRMNAAESLYDSLEHARSVMKARKVMEKRVKKKPKFGGSYVTEETKDALETFRKRYKRDKESIERAMCESIHACSKLIILVGNDTAGDWKAFLKKWTALLKKCNCKRSSKMEKECNLALINLYRGNNQGRNFSIGNLRLGPAKHSKAAMAIAKKLEKPDGVFFDCMCDSF